eukprot:766991-Hanusia_phi.AAC.14
MPAQLCLQQLVPLGNRIRYFLIVCRQIHMHAQCSPSCVTRQWLSWYCCSTSVVSVGYGNATARNLVVDVPQGAQEESRQNPHDPQGCCNITIPASQTDIGPSPNPEFPLGVAFLTM